MGKMVAQGAPLSAIEVSNVSDYLSGGEADATGWLAPNACPANRRTPKLDVKATMSGFGYDYSNKRQLSDAQTGLKPGDLDNMEVAWTMAFPQVGTMRGQAAIVGDTMFLPVADNNRVFALDISGDKPCVQWSYDGGRALRTSAGYGEMSNGQKIIMVGDMGGFVHAIDAKTGKKLWVTNVSFFKNQMVTSTPVLYKDRVFAPVSQYELASAMADAYVCCKARGGVTAINAKTGEKIWAQATMPEAQPIKDRGDGQFIWGPSGATDLELALAGPQAQPPVRRHGRGQLRSGAPEHRRPARLRPRHRQDRVEPSGDGERRLQCGLHARPRDQQELLGADRLSRRGLRRVDHLHQGAERQGACAGGTEVRFDVGDEPGDGRCGVAHGAGPRHGDGRRSLGHRGG